ncbi:hypothetical protein MIR68_004383 [Amoeboaphelidium protococcarum]|nr:hypothetical protein MIR68_004383 [Amoeboaphelidium protococcarum]
MPNDSKRKVDEEPAEHVVDDFQSINVDILGFGVDSVHWTQKDKKFLLLDHEQYGACLTCIGKVKYVNVGENGRSLQISLNPIRQQNKLFYEQVRDLPTQLMQKLKVLKISRSVRPHPLHVYDCNDVLDIIRGMDSEFYHMGVHLVNFVRRTIDPDELNAIASDLGLLQLLEHKDQVIGDFRLYVTLFPLIRAEAYPHGEQSIAQIDKVRADHAQLNKLQVSLDLRFQQTMDHLPSYCTAGAEQKTGAN